MTMDESFTEDAVAQSATDPIPTPAVEAPPVAEEHDSPTCEDTSHMETCFQATCPCVWCLVVDLVGPIRSLRILGDKPWVVKEGEINEFPVHEVTING